MTKDLKKRLDDIDNAIMCLLAKQFMIQRFLLHEAVDVHIMQHGKICPDCVRSFADVLGIDKEDLSDAEIELMFFKSQGRC